jgi:peptidyl-prolyl cis-trans isomerase C
MIGWARRILREPLVHFLGLGALIFIANGLLHPAMRNDDRRIEVTRADMDRIRAVYAQQWGGAAGNADMPNLLDNFIRSEILFREGAALGLGTDDSVLRNRIVQKMEFLLQDASAIAQPTEAEMADYLASHAAAYRTPERIAFAHVFFSASLRAAHAEADARAALDKILAGKAEAEGIGDPFMLTADSAPQSHDAIATDYGPAFADAVFALPAGTPANGAAWQGPIRSAFGFHLVRIVSRQPSRLPELPEIRATIHDAMMGERFQAAFDAAYAKVRAKYQVVVEPDALNPPANKVVSAGSR